MTKDPIDIPGLKHFVFPPPDSRPTIGAAIMIHGQGDHASRYEEILTPFRERGITCFATDLPGHGKSSGRRGEVPGLAAVDAIVTSDLKRARALCPDGPIGLLAHSVGGLLALRELLERPERYQFAWISSPLIWPERTRHPIIVALLRVLGKLLPGLSLSTGVTTAMCRHLSDEQDEEHIDTSLFHRRISLGWACELIELAQRIRREFPGRVPSLPVLITQGSADPVCPAPLLRSFLAQADAPNLSHVEFDGLLHEPFADPRREELATAISTWLEKVLPTAP